MRIGSRQVGAAAILIALAITGCAAAPPRLARTHPAPITVQASGPARWVDRAAGIVELRLACRPTTIEVWCRDRGRTHCEARRRLAEATACPGDVVTVTTRWGATAQTTVAPDGRATFTVDVAGASPGAAPGPGDGWIVARDGVALAWGEPTDSGTPIVVPPPRVPQRRYHNLMMVADLVIVASVPLAIATISERRPDVALGLGLIAYLTAGPLIHHLHGSGQAGRSLVRRLAYPLAGLIVSLPVAFVAGVACEENDCALDAEHLVVGGFALGVAAALLHDWARAHVDVVPAAVSPVISTDGDRAVFGLAGRF